MLQNRKLVWPAYLVAVSLVVIPPFDAAMQAYPFRLGDTTWRFGFFGLVSNAMAIPMIGVLIAFVVSAIFDYPALQRILGAVCALVAICIAGALILFALDVVQLHGHVKPGAYERAFVIASSTATIKALVAILILIGFTRAGLTRDRRPQKSSPKLSVKNNNMAADARVADGGSVNAEHDRFRS